jgi:hypothetical protein
MFFVVVSTTFDPVVVSKIVTLVLLIFYRSCKKKSVDFFG